jgi:hypothetical protein
MSLYLKRLPALALALTLGLAGCSDDPLSPEEVLDNFDAGGTQANLDAVDAAFNTPVFQSLAVLGEDFGIPGAPAASANLLAEAADLQSASLSHRVANATRRMSDVMSSAAAVLIPEQYRGLTLVYNLAEQAYVIDETQAGPDNGVRFMLYAVNPLARTIADPLNEIGYADLLDESSGDVASLRLVVVSEEVTYANYAATIEGTFLAPSFTLAGYVTDGTVRADFTLAYSFAVTLAGGDMQIDYDLDVEANDFHVDASFVFHQDNVEEITGATINILITHGDDTIVVAGSAENDSGSLTVTINEQLFATITFGPGSLTVTGTGDEPLSAEHRQVIEDIFQVFEGIIETFEHFFGPIEWLIDA